MGGILGGNGGPLTRGVVRRLCNCVNCAICDDTVTFLITVMSVPTMKLVTIVSTVTFLTNVMTVPTVIFVTNVLTVPTVKIVTFVTNMIIFML